MQKLKRKKQSSLSKRTATVYSSPKAFIILKYIRHHVCIEYSEVNSRRFRSRTSTSWKLFSAACVTRLRQHEPTNQAMVDHQAQLVFDRNVIVPMKRTKSKSLDKGRLELIDSLFFSSQRRNKYHPYQPNPPCFDENANEPFHDEKPG